MARRATGGIRGLIAQIFHDLGGCATAEDIYAHIRLIAPPELNEELLRRGWLAAIGEYLRSIGPDGLPIAPDIGGGVHMDLELFSVDDYRYVIGTQMSASRNARRRAVQYQQRCAAQYGVWIPLPEEDVG